MISTHAIPPFSYRVPERLADYVRVGSAVVAPLSGYPRLGIVVDREDPAGNYELEDVRSVVHDLSLSEEVVEVCRWAAEATATPLAAVLRSALPPGLRTDRYRVASPLPGWPWEEGDIASRAALRKVVGEADFKTAERTGRVELAPSLPQRGMTEWAVLEDGPRPDLRRAFRQRAVIQALEGHPGGCPVGELLAEADARRDALRQLVRRGAVRLEKRPEPAPILCGNGKEQSPELIPFTRSGGRIVDLGGAWVWRTPRVEWSRAVAAVAAAAWEDGEQTLVLAPEKRGVETLVRDLRRLLPPGLSVAQYHGGLGRSRAAIFEAARDGALDVLVGTRSAALLPLARLGAICVVDEPNGAYRAEPGFEGVPIHARDLALRRGGFEGAGVLFLSPTPSLRLHAPEHRVRNLPARTLEEWPAVRIVDMRGTGAAFSPEMLYECRRGASRGERVGTMSNWFGRAEKLYCQGCGAVRDCPACDLPLLVHDGPPACGRCGRRVGEADPCVRCGSERSGSAGLTAERMRAELSRAIEEPVGLLTTSVRDGVNRRVVVGVPRCIQDGAWETVIVPDADSLLLGSGMGTVERAFRTLHGVAQAAGRRILVQTRMPDHFALQTALGDDYPAFAAAELPRLRSAGYPPYAHLAAVTFEGPERSVRRAVKSRLLPALEAGVEASDLAPFASPGSDPAWRLLLRSEDRSVVARAATAVARQAAKLGKSGPKVRVDVDPEEV